MMPAVQHVQDKALILVVGKTEAFVDSRDMAKNLGNKPRAVIALIDRYATKFQELGHLLFKKALGERSQGGGKAERYALLNEDQAYFLLSLSRNSARVVDLKVRLVKAFREARRAADIRKTEYMPEYHALHDEVARVATGSPNERFIHMNFNKLVNKAVGIEAGQRGASPPITQSILTVVQSVAANAVRGTTDHREAYKRATSAVGNLTQSLQLGVAHA